MKRLLSIIAIIGSMAALTAAQSQSARKSLTTTTCPGVGCVSLSVSGLGGVGVQVTGTFSGTLTFEGTLDGVTYSTVNMTPVNSTTATTTATSTGVWSGGVGGMAVFRVRFSAYSSGTAVVSIQNAPTTARGSGGGGGGTPGGSNTQVQFNDSDAFGGDSGLTYNKTTNELSAERLLVPPTDFQTNADPTVVIGHNVGLGIVDISGQSGDFVNFTPLLEVNAQSNDGVNDGSITAEEIVVRALADGTGNMNRLRGLSVAWSAAKNVTNNITALNVNDLAITGGTVATARGLFIGNVAGATNNYAIQTSAGLVRFGDTVQIDATLTGAEITPPAAPAANGFVLFSQDDGGGKTQLCVRFNSGSVQCFASEP